MPSLPILGVRLQTRKIRELQPALGDRFTSDSCQSTSDSKCSWKRLLGLSFYVDGFAQLSTGSRPMVRCFDSRSHTLVKLLLQNGLVAKWNRR